MRKYYIILCILMYLFVEMLSYGVWHFYVSRSGRTGVEIVKGALGDVPLKKLRWLPHPYMVYWNNPSFEDSYGKQYDKNGYRSADYVPKAGQLKILALGGSTTNGYPYVRDPNQVWTSLLHQKLQDDGIENHVFNAGLPGGTSAELLMNYFMVAQYYQPDIVLLHVGGNDAFPLLYPHYQPDYMYYKQANGGVMRLRPFERTLVRYSYFYRNLVALWLVDQEFFIFPHVLQDMDRDATLARVRQQAPVAFQSNINAIMSHARANGAKVVLVGYMHIPYADYEKTDPSFLGFGRSMDMATAKNLQVMQQLAQEYQQLYVALDRSKFKADWFYDYCHLKAPGHQEKAQQIYAAMRANGVFEK